MVIIVIITLEEVMKWLLKIDGLIYIKKEKPLNLGDIVKVKISDIMEYDLMGEVLDEFSK